MEQDPTPSAGLLLVISGPSGVGKTTIVHEVERQLEATFSVSATTRSQLPGEVDGRDYQFVSEEAFAKMRDRGELLEYALVFGRHWYGTPRQPVEAALERGQLVILDIDVQGAIQVKQAMPEAFMVFILPPSEDELRRRLRERARDDDEAIQRRFARARDEIALAKQSNCYDQFVVNDELAEAVSRVCALVRERRSTAAARADS